MLNKFVDKVFVINLPHRKDRLESFHKYSEMFEFEYETFEAFDGKKLIDDNFIYDGQKVGPPYVNLSHFKACVGCLMSHLNLLKHCQEMNYSKVMIFEDDCAFHEEFNHRLLNLFSRIPDHWDMLYFSGSLPEFKENHEFYSTVTRIFTTHSYMVRSNVFNLIIENLLKKLFTSPVDVCYSDLHPFIKTYVAIPFLTYQSAGYSDIGGVYNDYESIKKYL